MSAIEIVVAEEGGGREVILNEEDRVEWISRLVDGYRGSWTEALSGEVASVMSWMSGFTEIGAATFL